MDLLQRSVAEYEKEFEMLEMLLFKKNEKSFQKE